MLYSYPHFANPIPGRGTVYSIQYTIYNIQYTLYNIQYVDIYLQFYIQSHVIAKIFHAFCVIKLLGVPRNTTVGEQFEMSSSMMFKVVLFYYKENNKK